MELDTLVVLLFNMILKGAVLITMALLVTRLRLIHSPAWRSLVWTGMLTALLALPFASVLLPELRMPGLPALDQKISQWLRADANGPAMSVPGQAHVVMDEQNLIRITPSNILRVVPDTRAPLTTPPVGSVSLWILLFSTLGVCLVVRRIHESYRSMQLMQETILSDRRSRLNDRLSLWTARMGIKRPIAIGFSEAVTVPALAGLKHPCILSLVTMFQASEEKLDAVIAHELAHVARQDLRWNFIVQVVRILYWFHPLVHLAYRRFLDAREEVCDEMAVAVLGYMRSYATTLLDVAAGLSRTCSECCPVCTTDQRRRYSVPVVLILLLSPAVPPIILLRLFLHCRPLWAPANAARFFLSSIRTCHAQDHRITRPGYHRSRC